MVISENTENRGHDPDDAPEKRRLIVSRSGLFEREMADDCPGVHRREKR